MYLELRGGTGAATSDNADDVYATSDNKKDDFQDDDELLDASQMPDDYYFTGMIAFFMWGFMQYTARALSVVSSSILQLLVSSTTIQWPCKVLGYTGRLVIKQYSVTIHH
jgi:hypothetical protein